MLIVIKIETKLLFDGTPLYNSIIYSFIHFGISFCFFTTLRYYINKWDIKSNRIIDFFDKYSYYIYIVHYMFIVGPLCINKLTLALTPIIIIIIMCSVISAIVLKIGSDLLYKKIAKMC